MSENIYISGINTHNYRKQDYISELCWENSARKSHNGILWKYILFFKYVEWNLANFFIARLDIM